MNETGAKNSEKVGLFQIVVLILSIIVLGALGADAAFKLPKEVSDILQTLDTLVCILLLTDFVIRFYKAESKLAFMKWGWIDLIASIPNIPILRVGRFVRILRIIRLLRAIRATHKVSSILLKSKLQCLPCALVLTDGQNKTSQNSQIFTDRVLTCLFFLQVFRVGLEFCFLREQYFAALARRKTMPQDRSKFQKGQFQKSSIPSPEFFLQL